MSHESNKKAKSIKLSFMPTTYLGRKLSGFRTFRAITIRTFRPPLKTLETIYNTFNWDLTAVSDRRKQPLKKHLNNSKHTEDSMAVLPNLEVHGAYDFAITFLDLLKFSRKIHIGGPQFATSGKIE